MSIEKLAVNVSAGTSSEVEEIMLPAGPSSSLVEEIMLPAGPSLWPFQDAGGATAGGSASVSAGARRRPAKRRRPSVKPERYHTPTFLTPAELEEEIRLAGFDAAQSVSYLHKAERLGEVPGWSPLPAVHTPVNPFTPTPADLPSRGRETSPGLRWVVASEDITLDDAEAPTLPASAFTRKISAEDFDKLYTAVCYANSCGWILNVEMTITWPLLGCRSDTEAGAALAHVRHLMYHFCADKRRLPFVLVWVMERGPERGLHTHLAAHLPIAAKADFLRWLRGALATVTGVDPDAVLERSSAHDGQRLRPLHCDFRSGYSAYSQWQWFKYMMKGIDPTPLVRSGDEPVEGLWRVLGVWPEPVGVMSTKRWGVTRSIDRGARGLFHSPFRAGDPLFTDDFYRSWLGAQTGGAALSWQPDDVVSRLIEGWNRR